MLTVEKIDRASLPPGHVWMLVQRGRDTTAYVVDGAAERVARAVYAKGRETA